MWSMGRQLARAHLALDLPTCAVFTLGICQPSRHLGVFAFVFAPILPPYLSPLTCQSNGCLVPLAWGLMNAWCGFSSHVGVGGFYQGAGCQEWKARISQAANLYYGHVFLNEFFSHLETDNKRFFVSSFCY